MVTMNVLRTHEGKAVFSDKKDSICDHSPSIQMTKTEISSFSFVTIQYKYYDSMFKPYFYQIYTTKTNIVNTEQGHSLLIKV